MDLSIIIVSFNTKELLKNCLKSLMVNERWLMTIGEVIVVDDASPDGSNQFLEKNYPEIKIVKHEKNLGFAAACNSGAKMTKGEIFAQFN